MSVGNINLQAMLSWPTAVALGSPITLGCFKVQFYPV